MPPPASSSCHGYGFRAKDHANFSTQQIEQDRHALAVKHTLVKPDAIRESAFAYLQLVARRESWTARQLNIALLVAAQLQFLNHGIRNAGRHVAVRNEMRYSKGRLNAAPALCQKVDGDEEIAREQRRGDGVEPACVAAALEVQWKINLEALP